MTVTHLIGTVGSSRGVPILNHQIEQTSKFYFTEGIWQSGGKSNLPFQVIIVDQRELLRLVLRTCFNETGYGYLLSFFSFLP